MKVKKRFWNSVETQDTGKNNGIREEHGNSAQTASGHSPHEKQIRTQRVTTSISTLLRVSTAARSLGSSPAGASISYHRREKGSERGSRVGALMSSRLQPLGGALPVLFWGPVLGLRPLGWFLCLPTFITKHRISGRSPISSKLRITGSHVSSGLNFRNHRGKTAVCVHLVPHLDERRALIPEHGRQC